MPPEIQSSSQVFISYNHSDRAACVQLRTELEKAGLSVFQDEKNIHRSDRWLTELQNALQQCSAFVLLIGKDGIRRWVGAEVEVALTRHLAPHDDAERLPIFPILLDDAQPESLPPFLALFQVDRWKPSDPLADALIEAIKTRTIRSDSKTVFEGCPYLGLSAFSRDDARLFFGRRRETLEALTYLGNQQQSDPEQLHQHKATAYTRWLQIEGNSGSGKSSLVNAGMLPLIERDALWARTGFEHWHILGSMMPGKTPLEKLAETLEQGLIEDPTRRNALGRLKRLKEDARALAFTLKDFKRDNTAFLLIIDQFEELFTFADESERKQFDVLLTAALADPECPLFLINTVRADFLDRFEYLPHLQSIYNTQCKRYFLPLISAQGLQDCIEQPAKLADLDVSEITTAILKDAQDEIGALPLVENALLLLWQQRQDHKLSGQLYQQQGGIAGMLSSQADALLARIDQAVPQGKLAALELLLRLTRINDEGRHTRQRVTLDEAIFVAGNGDDKTGRKVVGMLSGERDNAAMHTEHHNVLRLITINREQDRHYADLIHETLIRVRGKDIATGKLIGYWPTLFDYIDNNHDRDQYRQLLAHESKQWQHSEGLGRIWNLRWFGLSKFRQLRTPKHSIEGRFLAWSKRMQAGLLLMLAILVLYGTESIVWVQRHDLSPDMIWTLQRFRFGGPILPALTVIPSGSFNMGEQDAAFIAGLGEAKKYFGVPGKTIQIAQPFYMSTTEITYEQYDYYVWQQHRAGNKVEFPSTAKGGRGDQPVVNVNWFEAVAYAHWLSEQTGQQCRLPTEAEWEYAARAGTTTAYHWGDKPGSNNANCDGCGSRWDNQEAAPAGSFSANQYGLYDMSGNVWEWTCSNWRERFDGSEQHCNNDDTDSQYRVVRGGSWNHSPDRVRSAVRGHHLDLRPDLGNFDVGFRVLCESSIQ
ncbi:SUMF1/EgtB/PvdO family nonheme iron enzyme [Nitrosomonas sp.]|uniref:nSTAND1 domain-containing NTPase n=1 Tax=Nitrosomonas sp. TaxID=42353 RepID=UPI001DE71D15|nr:SUMF1/EgtB/PvdO family nonheme iron enzyme [Nitrosomonas sp.]MBX3617338.1 SUMF1/EgtB/PvdO family nonheme iron enzyme [Nitrosomonas sp.]